MPVRDRKGVCAGQLAVRDRMGAVRRDSSRKQIINLDQPHSTVPPLRRNLKLRRAVNFRWVYVLVGEGLSWILLERYIGWFRSLYEGKEEWTLWARCPIVVGSGLKRYGWSVRFSVGLRRGNGRARERGVISIKLILQIWVITKKLTERFRT